MHGIMRQEFKTAALRTISAMVERIKKAFENMPLPVIVDDQFNCVPDYEGKYESHIDEEFGGFSYSEHDSGYHVVKLTHNSGLPYRADVQLKKHHSDEITLLDTSRSNYNEVRSTWGAVLSCVV